MTVERLDDGRVRVTPPLTDDDVRELRAGDAAVIRGTVIAARDAGHARIASMLERGEELPFDPSGAVIYYVGPTPERPGHVIGAAGPSTSGRMDRQTPRLLELGVKGMIGKGRRSDDVKDALQRFTAVYFAAIGGGGAVAARTVTSQRVIAFDDLGPEALRLIELHDLPVYVVNDSFGGDLYADAPKRWRREDALRGYDSPR